ncbi:MAG: GMC family oxidoreductase [Crocinitomicaceae bacterium]|nr:GMC family oxidoreductase [Crocinitomicaceae bacterium]
MMKYDVCVVGSGAGAGPVIYELSKAGFNVVVLEKGPWFNTEHFSKDEMVATRRDLYKSDLEGEFHVVESKNDAGEWEAKTTQASGKSYWNGNCVGGSSNFMSAYFHRLKPNDFKLASTYPDTYEGSNTVDWPISYDDLEPYYAKVETEIGVSGKVVPHKALEPRSTEDFPYPPLGTNVFGEWVKEAAKEENVQTFPAPRGIISSPKGKRKACYHSNYCGSFGCSSDAKGSSRAALLDQAIETGNCKIIPHAKVFHLDCGDGEEIQRAKYYDSSGEKNIVEARLFVVACQAVETSRLLLMSKSDKFPNGLANNSGNVGKNLLFAGGGAGSGIFDLNKLDEDKRKKFDIPLTFVNQATQDFYEIDDEEFGPVTKGGTIDFLIEHSAPMPKLIRQKRDENGKLLYGSALKSKIHDSFRNKKRVRFEVFNDWIPNDDSFIKLSEEHVDKWGDPVGHIRIGYLDEMIRVGKYIAKKATRILFHTGARDLQFTISGAPPRNLMAGGCRFGTDPKTSVLDANCQAHEVNNLYVTDASFMPTGGSVPYTFTIYANSFRVADKIIERLNSEA